MKLNGNTKTWLIIGGMVGFLSLLAVVLTPIFASHQTQILENDRKREEQGIAIRKEQTTAYIQLDNKIDVNYKEQMGVLKRIEGYLEK